jgi:hypothetical protein
MRHLLFHPSLELNKAVTDNFKLILGTWWDVNDQATSSIGNRVQEVDVWFGGAYTTGILTTTVLYQQWMYLNLNEQAVELKLAVDTFLKPYVLIHERLATDYNDGTVAILGASYDFKAGPVSFSVPAAVEVESSGYHGGKKAVSVMAHWASLAQCPWSLSLKAHRFQSESLGMPRTTISS